MRLEVAFNAVGRLMAFSTSFSFFICFLWMILPASGFLKSLLSCLGTTMRFLPTRTVRTSMSLSILRTEEWLRRPENSSMPSFSPGNLMMQWKIRRRRRERNEVKTLPSFVILFSSLLRARWVVKLLVWSSDDSSHGGCNSGMVVVVVVVVVSLLSKDYRCLLCTLLPNNYSRGYYSVTPLKSTMFIVKWN